jgi:uncharacterized membrane protein SpoIIM required for sporulation
MILNLERFIASEKPVWDQLETELHLFEQDPFRKLNVQQAEHFYFLYQRAASDLARLGELPGHAETRARLEALVRRAYAEAHESRRGESVSPFRFLFRTFPAAFRLRIKAFWLSCAITLLGTLFGAGAITFDPDAKPVLMPFTELMESPGQRVKREETVKVDRLGDEKSTFAAELITHNIKVSFFTLALGTSWGLGSVVMLFYNGVTLGAVAADYLSAGYALFLFGWLLPHGVIEIPAILIAGQAGLLLGGALIGWGDPTPRRQRLRSVSGDVLALAGGLAAMLVWAGLVEAFLSQYHQPFVPYAAKIGFGIAELFLLSGWLFGGAKK